MPKQAARVPSRTDVQRAFGAAVKGLRGELALTQEQLADLTGVHVTYVSQIERGRRNVSLYNIHRLALALGTSASTLMLSAEQL